MQILVTGGAGYIGSHTVVALLEGGHQVAVLDNYTNSSADILKQIEKITGKHCLAYEADVTDAGQIDALMAEIWPDSVLHFAGRKSVAESIERPDFYHQKMLAVRKICSLLWQNLAVIRLLFPLSQRFMATQKNCL